MFTLTGKYGEAKIFTDNCEQEAQSQVARLLNHSAFEDSTIRIMPDCHAGAGCVIGFTATNMKRVVPNLIGVDISCGVTAIKTNLKEVNFEDLDKFIRKEIPNGFSHNQHIDASIPTQLRDDVSKICKIIDMDSNTALKSIGSLGGGNHFIELNRDIEGNYWVVVHSGSRGFGLSIAKYYQKLAIHYCNEVANKFTDQKNKLIGTTTDRSVIQNKIEELDKLREPYKIEKELSFLEGELREEYLVASEVAQRYAQVSRKIMCDRILKHLNTSAVKIIESIHNYISFPELTVRKGAISAKLGEDVIIPINMRDGIIIGKGKGNKDWNESAPHGAGRLLSRTKAKETLDLEVFKSTMSDVWTSCVSSGTLDESPMAYKPIEEILENIQDTIEIVEIIKPVYNFKAEESRKR